MRKCLRCGVEIAFPTVVRDYCNKCVEERKTYQCLTCGKDCLSSYGVRRHIVATGHSEFILPLTDILYQSSDGLR